MSQQAITMKCCSYQYQAASSVMDLLRSLRRSGLLAGSRCDEIGLSVSHGELPGEPPALARRLVRDGILTEYQARRILWGRPEGLVVGRYAILDRIGSGETGEVFKARHLMMRRLAALKFLAPDAGRRHDPNRLARFRREMQLVARLDHPNIVRAYDADRLGDHSYLVMEYIPGRNLAATLRAGGPLSPDRALGVGWQAARGLGYIHSQGVVHRDVKPANLLVTRDGRVKLLDLGLGVLLERDPGDGCQTEVGSMLGTMDYAAPEQICGRTVDARSDLYALGCTLLHLMSGRLPFEGESPMERMAARVLGRTIPVRRMMPDLPAPVVAILEKMLACDPADRPQTAAEVEADLRPFRTAHAAAPATTPEPAVAVAVAPPVVAPVLAPHRAGPSPTPTPTGLPRLTAAARSFVADHLAPPTWLGSPLAHLLRTPRPA